MNERIRELAEQSGLQPFEDMGPGYVYKMKMFAELLVLECIGCCEQVISDPVPASVDTWLNGGSQCIDEIKQHFGVK
jgi:hypothetical protein